MRLRLQVQDRPYLPGLLIDGTQIIPPPYFRQFGIPVPEQERLLTASPCSSISAASILAKTFRDALM